MGQVAAPLKLKTLNDSPYVGECLAFYYPRVCSYPWFAYYDLVKVIVFGEGIEDLGHETFMRYRNVEKLMLPNSLKSLGLWTFYGCASLTEVTIPANVVHFYSAFDYCSNLKKVTCLAAHPPIVIVGEYAFEDIAEEAVLYVPEASIEEYRQNDCWNKSFKQIRGIIKNSSY